MEVEITASGEIVGRKNVTNGMAAELAFGANPALERDVSEAERSGFGPSGTRP